MKRTLNLLNAEVEPEPEDVVEDEERVDLEEPIKFQNRHPEPGDYVLVEYAGKEKKRHYIRLITQAKDEEGDFEVKFLRKSAKHVMSCCFVEPYTEEINSGEGNQFWGFYLMQRVLTQQRGAGE